MVSETVDEAQSVAALAAAAGVPGASGEEEQGQPSAPLPSLLYFLRKERCPANDRRFYALGAGAGSLRDALRGRVVVEHPVVVVCAADAPDTHPREVASSPAPGDA